MSKKIKQVAKELEMDPIELLERVKNMGISVTDENSVLTEMDEKAVKNLIIHSRKKAETTIVKVRQTDAGKKSRKSDEVKIDVKQAKINVTKVREEKRPVRQAAVVKPAKSSSSPMGTPLPKSVSVQPPIGTPLPKSATVQPPVGTPLPKSVSVQVPVGIPLPKSESQQPIREREEEIKIEAVASEKGEVKEAPKEAEKEAPKEAMKEAQKETPKELLKEISKETPKEAKKEAAVSQDKNLEIIVEKEQSKPSAKAMEKTKDQVAGEVSGKPIRKAAEKPVRKSGEQASIKPSEKVSRGHDTKKMAGVQADEKRGRRKASDSVEPAYKSGKKERQERYEATKEEKIAQKSGGKKKYLDKRSMEKPTLKKPHKSKEKPVEVESSIIIEELAPGTKIITVPITVKGLSEQIDKTSSEVIMALMRLGTMANINQNLDEDTVILIGEELGIPIVIDKVEEEVAEDGLELFDDSEEDLKARPPIITVMGHVDHGKTSLLDAIRKTSVTTLESGGITQHIGASEVSIKGQKIVFLDTPGHEAFTAMRARGAHVTDIAILVVAADDSVKPQTIESISHAKAAGVPIIVAINKIDKEAANPDRVKQDLTEHGILVEEWGGDTICVPVSAKSGEGIINLLEMVLLQAEVLELRANPNRLALGTVIEARLDKAKGPVATLLVLNGTLEAGMSIVAGTSAGRIRAMTNFKGESIKKAGPATAVEVLGLTEVPEAGDEFNAVREDRIAREIAEQRKSKVREEVMKRTSSVSLEELFEQIQEGEVKELNLIIKADVQGSVGALTQSLEKLKNENVKVKIIHTGVGTVTESDVMLANTAGAIIIGFNVRPSTNVSNMAEREGVQIRTYRVIYEAIDEVELAMKGMLDPIYKEVVLGKIEIRETFKVPGVGIIGGAYVQEGKVQRNAEVRLVRDGIVIHEGKISSLKRFKDDVREVAHGYECGIGIENYNDIKQGDIIEAFKMEEIKR
ncbi:MAG: translation initiation factor IF-2 [Anaerovoracaceae bacterium]|jgi:translation initiation factor IF-2